MRIVERVRSDGFGAIVTRRWNWYRSRLMVNNPVVGKLVELAGDTVRMDGLTYSVATPNISRGHKSTLAFGLHEMEERDLVKRWLPAEYPVLELGGGLGVVSCLANRKLADPARHVVVEANPRMIPVLEGNRDRNRCRFKVLNAAVAYGVERIELSVDAEFVGSNLAGVGPRTDTVTVPATTVAALADGAGFDRFSLISDIEGAEADVILHELPQLGERVRFALIELHPYVLGDYAVAALMDRMVEIGFRLVERQGAGEVFCVAYAR